VSLEDKVKETLNKVLDVKPEEVQLDTKLDEAFGVDSTEMVEISVGLKKELSIELADNELKKTHSFSEIVEILKSKGAQV
jgi:acyl carrier protein